MLREKSRHLARERAVLRLWGVMERGQQVEGDKDSTATQSQGTGRDGTEAKPGIFDCPQAPPPLLRWPVSLFTPPNSVL